MATEPHLRLRPLRTILLVGPLAVALVALCTAPFLSAGGVVAYIENRSAIVPLIIGGYIIAPIATYFALVLVKIAVFGSPAYYVRGGNLVYCHPWIFSVPTSSIQSVQIITQSFAWGRPARYLRFSLPRGNVRHLPIGILDADEATVRYILSRLVGKTVG